MRWAVHLALGLAALALALAPLAANAGPRANGGQYVLAISWEPAFCEGNRGKPECRSQTPDRHDAGHFSLHGLWPSREYCGVDRRTIDDDKAGDWDALPEPELSAATRAALAEAMPGTQSGLERHEWIKHGTCAGVSAETFFGRALLFLEAVDNSAVGALMRSRVGRMLQGYELQQAFDTAFGDGAGDRIRLACERDGNRRLIAEITIGLRGDVFGSGGIDELIAASRPTDPGCNGGMVDRVGNQ